MHEAEGLRQDWQDWQDYKTAGLQDKTMPGSCQVFESFYNNLLKIKQRMVAANTILFLFLRDNGSQYTFLNLF